MRHGSSMTSIALPQPASPANLVRTSRPLDPRARQGRQPEPRPRRHRCRVHRCPRRGSRRGARLPGPYPRLLRRPGHRPRPDAPQEFYNVGSFEHEAEGSGALGVTDATARSASTSRRCSIASSSRARTAGAARSGAARAPSSASPRCATSAWSLPRDRPAWPARWGESTIRDVSLTGARIELPAGTLITGRGRLVVDVPGGAPLAFSGATRSAWAGAGGGTLVGFEFDDGQNAARAHLALALFGAADARPTLRPAETVAAAPGAGLVAPLPSAA